MDKKLFTPGPLNTSTTVKSAMQRDLGSRDSEFIALVHHIRTSLLNIAGVSKEMGYESIIVQGSGTSAIEAVISSVIPLGGILLIIENGAYGRRISQIASAHTIQVEVVRCKENEVPAIEAIEAVISSNPGITHLAAVHCETTSGIINPVAEIGRCCRNHGITYILDAMSSFGAIPVRMAEWAVGYLISSANKCIEGVPGFAYVVASRDELMKATHARTLTLDLLAQWKGLEANGQFRFTPPTHAMLAFRQALAEHKEDGGVTGRGNRYRQNYDRLMEGMLKMGFNPYVPESLRGYIITSFYHPDNQHFQFDDFYKHLSDKGFVIYPGKLSKEQTFRIGNIGQVGPKDIDGLLGAIREYIVLSGQTL